jgi:LytS/YehU family sensor histidine kinase
MALLTLVENAIRHGVDPGCDQARVEGRRAARSRRHGEHLGGRHRRRHGRGERARAPASANLKARLRAFFGEQARFELSEQAPHGVRAELRVAAP